MADLFLDGLDLGCIFCESTIQCMFVILFVSVCVWVSHCEWTVHVYLSLHKAYMPGMLVNNYNSISCNGYSFTHKSHLHEMVLHYGRQMVICMQLNEKELGNIFHDLQIHCFKTHTPYFEWYFPRLCEELYISSLARCFMKFWGRSVFTMLYRLCTYMFTYCEIFVQSAHVYIPVVTFTNLTHWFRLTILVPL